jgi:hypothetical protein
VISVVDGVQHQVHPGGDPEFVGYPEQVFLHRVLAESQFLPYQSMSRVYERLIASKKRVIVREAKSHPPNAGKRPLRVAFIGGRGVIGKYSGIEGYYEEVGSRLAAAGHERRRNGFETHARSSDSRRFFAGRRGTRSQETYRGALPVDQYYEAK